MERLTAPLVHLAEECGELTQAATKIIRFGAASVGVTVPPKSNRTAIEEEAGDVLALIKILVKAGLIDSKRLKTRKQFKFNKLKGKYL